MNQGWQSGPSESVLHFEVVFCRVLTSNWKVSTGRSPQSFITFIQTTQNFVIILYIEDIETNLPNWKAYLACII